MDMEICCENATQQNPSSTGESGGGILPMIDLAWSPANLLLGAAAGFGGAFLAFGKEKKEHKQSVYEELQVALINLEKENAESLKKKEAEHSDALEILSRELQSSVDALKKERSSLSIKNEKLNEDLTRLQKLFQEKEKQLSESIQDRKREVAESDEVVEMLQKDLKSAQQKSDNDIASLRLELTSVKRAKSAVESTLKILEEKHKSLEEEKKKLEKDLRNRVVGHEKVQHENDTLVKNLSDEQKRSEGLRRNLQRQGEEIVDLRDKLGDLKGVEQKVKDKEAEIGVLKGKLEETEFEKQSLGTQLEATKLELDREKDLSKRLAEKAALMSKDLDAHEQENEKEIGMLRNEIQRLKMALAVQEQENEKEISLMRSESQRLKKAIAVMSDPDDADFSET